MPAALAARLTPDREKRARRKVCRGEQDILTAVNARATPPALKLERFLGRDIQAEQCRARVLPVTKTRQHAHAEAEKCVQSGLTRGLGLSEPERVTAHRLKPSIWPLRSNADNVPQPEPDARARRSSKARAIFEQASEEAEFQQPEHSHEPQSPA